MEFIKQIGNVKVYIKKNADKDIKVMLYNGADLIASEVYFTDDENKAINTLLEVSLDIYTEDVVKSLGAFKHSENTFELYVDMNLPESDWFCRIDDTAYFKNYFKNGDSFVRDKDGMRIIDR